MATSVTDQVDVDFLQAFAEAWNRHDIEALMSFMADECSFNSSMGPDALGTHYEGREQVREGYQGFLNAFADGQWGNARHFVSGDRGVSEWTFTATAPDGSRIEANGCDIFTFRDSKIALKDSFRKNRTSS
jgi:ketosteroid isomerase-like protein